MEEKTYKYDPKRYAVKQTGSAYFSIFILIYAVVKYFQTQALYYVPVIIVCLYIIWESLITLANPSEVTVCEEKITFRHKNREETWYWKDIHDFRVKDFPTRLQCYIRINKDEFHLTKGRYWVYCYYFNDGEELFRYILNKEMEIHPDTVKSYARRGSKPAEKE